MLSVEVGPKIFAPSRFGTEVQQYRRVGSSVKSHTWADRASPRARMPQHPPGNGRRLGGAPRGGPHVAVHVTSGPPGCFSVCRRSTVWRSPKGLSAGGDRAPLGTFPLFANWGVGVLVL